MDDSAHLDHNPSIGPTAAHIRQPAPVSDTDRQLRRIVALLHQQQDLTQAISLDDTVRRLTALEAHITQETERLAGLIAAHHDDILKTTRMRHNSLMETVESRTGDITRDIGILSQRLNALTDVVAYDLWPLFWRSAWLWFKSLFQRGNP